ncbi:MAG TPA: thiamine/thiamine pyrophosphate ABC transporter permease ThiP [Devosia sp.]|nr:thiamine/thiamine pyrophosphate ABC transporter permease ThiP [Devosia sp.]
MNSATLPPRPLRRAAGAIFAAAIGVLVILLFRAIIVAAAGQGEVATTSVDIWHLIRMTSIQAGLSTVLSLAVGIALAWALNRLRFPGRGLVVGLFASAIVTPGLIIAFGLLTVWGRSGWIGMAAHALGLGFDVPIFGLGGILAAHVILDGAFAARVLLGRLDAVPAGRLKTGQSLGLSASTRFVLIDWPMMRTSLPGLAAIIFLLAFTSFPIVLLLGGGPANQTLEVAIYSAVRLDFDLGAAVELALVQMVICAAIILVSAAVAPIPASIGGAAAPGWRDRGSARALQWGVLLLAVVGFALPLLAVLLGPLGGGVAALLGRPAFWRAAGTSLVVATLSSALTLLLALGLGMARAGTARLAGRLALTVPAYTYLAVPAMVLSLGFFLLVRGLGVEPGRLGPAVAILGNALLSLPFALATLGPPLEAIASGQGKLIRSLGLSGWRQFAAVEWPLIGRDVGVVLALAFCFSLGDLGIISLFGTPDFTTLPLLLVEALGAYRTNDAAVIAALMLIGTVVAFTVLPPLFERLARART